MPRRRARTKDQAGTTERSGSSSFRWPSRRKADAAERAAGVAAEAGLERLRARAPKALESKPPPQPIPPAPGVELEAALHRQALLGRRDGGSPVERSDPPAAEIPHREPPAPEPEPEREPAPAPWDEDLDELAEQLVAQLRRDLGPQGS